MEGVIPLEEAASVAFFHFHNGTSPYFFWLGAYAEEPHYETCKFPWSTVSTPPFCTEEIVFCTGGRAGGSYRPA